MRSSFPVFQPSDFADWFLVFSFRFNISSDLLSFKGFLGSSSIVSYILFRANVWGFIWKQLENKFRDLANFKWTEHEQTKCSKLFHECTIFSEKQKWSLKNCVGLYFDKSVKHWSISWQCSVYYFQIGSINIFQKVSKQLSVDGTYFFKWYRNFSSF